MYIEKVIHLTITKEEQETLKKAEKILEEVCEVLGEDCEECPFYNLCSNSDYPHSPSSMIYKYISALPVED